MLPKVKPNPSKLRRLSERAWTGRTTLSSEEKVAHPLTGRPLRFPRHKEVYAPPQIQGLPARSAKQVQAIAANIPTLTSRIAIGFSKREGHFYRIALLDRINATLAELNEQHKGSPVAGAMQRKPAKFVFHSGTLREAVEEPRADYWVVSIKSLPAPDVVEEWAKRMHEEKKDTAQIAEQSSAIKEELRRLHLEARETVERIVATHRWPPRR